jgi:hypothetical protein
MATSCVFEKQKCTFLVAGLGGEFWRFCTPHFLRNKLKKITRKIEKLC